MHEKQSPVNTSSVYQNSSANRRNGSQFSQDNSAKRKSQNRGRSTKSKQNDDENPKEQVKKPMSRYMQELIRLNFIDMIHRYDKHQKVKRIEAVTLTK